jgi:CheY-like chemotaxis protein
VKILIAEDDPISRKLLATNLTNWGHDVIVTCDGKEAGERLNDENDIRMAVLDWMMPHRDGLEVCSEIKQNRGGDFVYVIMLTAKTQKDHIVTALDAGADDYVTKPFDAAELRSRVRAGERIVTLESRLTQKIGELEHALAHVKQLQGIIPICAWCKKIRDDRDYWSSVEDYIGEHSQAEFSHSICPSCRDEHFGQLGSKTTQVELQDEG